MNASRSSSAAASGYPRIADYAVIGDGRTAALVSTDGAVEWLCLPRFDSPSVFGAMLDRRTGGWFRIAPVHPYTVSRRYVHGTNVLETTFRTAEGTCVLRDAMHVGEDPSPQMTPEHELLRIAVGVDGEVELEIEFVPRPRYGRSPRLKQRGALGIWLDAGRTALCLRSEAPLTLESGHVTGRCTLHAGDEVATSLAGTSGEPAVVPALGEDARARMSRTIAWWQAWSRGCTYTGPYREEVLRSALVLRSLVFTPSGAVVAAPTSSLPERIGGERNWDYRYCWLRDASFTLAALIALGQHAEAGAFQDWLIHSTSLTHPGLQVLYNVFGEAYVPERSLAGWDGYMGSRPVRVGNDAHRQFQLDVYGEVASTVARALGDEPVDRDTARALRQIGDRVCQRWLEPDDGIWEARQGRFHYTHSKVMCWVALTSLIDLHERGRVRLPVERYRRERDAIRATIETRGFNEQLQTYTRVLDGDEVDASLLVLPFHGYIDAHHPRMRGTWERIRRVLMEDGLVRRYVTGADGIAGEEGTFGICSFWAVEYLALAGEYEEAKSLFDRLLSRANDVGLYGEEFADDGSPLGNFPQAYTHVGLINAALALQQRGPASTTGETIPGQATK